MWYSPSYMSYANDDEERRFNSRTRYGYINFERFVDAVTTFKYKDVTLEELDAGGLPTLKNTIATTAMLEAGGRSLDDGGGMKIVESAKGWEIGMNGNWVVIRTYTLNTLLKQEAVSSHIE